MPADLRFHVDRLVVSGKRVFVWGWVTDRERAISDVHLELRGHGWQKRLAAIFGLAREDVVEALPSHATARFSGFVVTGYVPDASVLSLSLEVTFDDGGCATLDLGGVAEVSAPSRLWRAVGRRLKARDFGGLLRRQSNGGAGIASADDRRGREALVRSLRAARSVRIIFDHDMGGGANHYRRGTIAQWLAASETVILCTYHLPTLDYRLHVFVPGERDRQFRARSFLALETVLQRAPVAEMFVNSPVSFDEPTAFADWLARMRRRHSATRITVTVHDFFTACPSFVLLDADGRYCGIPDVRECERCLRKHEATYVAFSPPTKIGPWREAWGRCLEAADEVRCFSESTRVLLIRAYPWLARDRTTVIPHRVDFSPRRPRVRHAGPLVIGVMGQINAQKGARVVAGIAERIEQQHPNVRVVVLGTLEAPFRPSCLTVTGEYKREDLPDLIEAHGINMFLFPSIWPETFSYVVAEMTALELPVVAFDLGAPAERLRSYRLARLCGEVGVDSALETMLAFHRELAMGETAAA
jgi:glycosyltransferase involved in cell wall biosynthesis